METSITNSSSVVDLRNATDEYLPELLESLGYEQSFTLIDAKLGLGLLTVAIAGLLFYLDKHYSFKDTYYVIIGCIVVYFLISMAHLYLLSGPEKNNKYVGYSDSKQKILVHTWTSKYDPIYNVKLFVNDKEQADLQIPFTEFFDSFGYLNKEAFTGLLKTGLQKKRE